MNRKGFTLIELLGVIVIIGLVLGLSSFGIIKLYNSSKSKAMKVSFESLKKAAIEYSEEYRNGNDYWNKYDNEKIYACTTIRSMKNKGLFKKNAILYDKNNNPLNDDTYIVILKNNLTKVYDDILIDSSKCDKLFDIDFLFEPNGTKGDNDWWTSLSIKYKLIIDDIGKIDNISYFVVNNNKEGNLEIGDLSGQNVNIIENSIKTKICVLAEGKNGKIIKKCSDNYKLDSIPPTTPVITINNNGDTEINGSTDNISPTISYLSSSDGNNYVSNIINLTSGNRIYAKAKDEAGNESQNVNKVYIEENSASGTLENLYRYKCSKDNKIYSTYDEAQNACTNELTEKTIPKELTTYSCPSGYTCQGGVCNSSSKCVKTILGNIQEVYYCPHDGSYQTSPECSYTGWEKGTLDLTCATTQTCSNYYYCSSGTYSNGYCWLWNRTSCQAGWNRKQTGKCDFTCSYGNVLLYAKCSGTTTCGSNYSCVSSCAGINDPYCRGGYQLPGPGRCSTDRYYYNCYRNPNVGQTCSTAGYYYPGNYSGKCREAGAYDVSNGIKCKLFDVQENPQYPIGQTECLSGYTVKERTLYANCPDWLKITASDGNKYCNTADYHAGRSCTSNIGSGATAVYNLTCSKTGDKKYYCDANQTYYNSNPSNCKKDYYEDINITQTTEYVCPDGYVTTDNIPTENSVCTKKESVGTVSTSKIYRCSLNTDKYYEDNELAAKECSNYCVNDNTKYYSNKNKCIGLSD